MLQNVYIYRRIYNIIFVLIPLPPCDFIIEQVQVRVRVVYYRLDDRFRRSRINGRHQCGCALNFRLTVDGLATAIDDVQFLIGRRHQIVDKETWAAPKGVTDCV